MQAKRFLFLHIFKLLLTELSLKQLPSIYRDLRNYSCGPHNLAITWQTKDPSRMESGTQNSYTIPGQPNKSVFHATEAAEQLVFPNQPSSITEPSRDRKLFHLSIQDQLFTAKFRQLVGSIVSISFADFSWQNICGLIFSVPLFPLSSPLKSRADYLSLAIS